MDNLQFAIGIAGPMYLFLGFFAWLGQRKNGRGNYDEVMLGSRFASSRKRKQMDPEALKHDVRVTLGQISVALGGLLTVVSQVVLAFSVAATVNRDPIMYWIVFALAIVVPVVSAIVVFPIMFKVAKAAAHNTH